MNKEVYGAYDEGCEEERRNGLYDNTSMKEVNVIRDNREKPEDDRIHYNYAKAKGEDNDRAEYKLEYRLQNEVEKSQEKRNKDERLPIRGAELESSYIFIRKP